MTKILKLGLSCNDRVLWRRSRELHKSAKLNFVMRRVITSQYRSCIMISVNLVAILCMALDADGQAPPVQEKINRQNLVFSFSIIFVDTAIFGRSGNI